MRNGISQTSKKLVYLLSKSKGDNEKYETMKSAVEKEEDCR